MNRSVPGARTWRTLVAVTTIAATTIAATLAFISTAAFAAEPAGQATLEDLIKLPSTILVRLSRTGNNLAVVTPNRGRMNVGVIDMTTRKGTLVTSFEDFDVVGLDWVGDERLVFSLGQLNTPTGPSEFNAGGLFMVNR